MISTLTLSNIKGQTRTLQLEKMNLLYGLNSGGKTAVLDAVTLATLGFHPRLGRKPNLTFNLCTHGENSMSVGFDRKVINWVRNSKGAVTVEGLDQILDLPPAMIDLREWLALTGPQRVRYIIEHCGSIKTEGMEAIDRLILLNPRVDQGSKELDRKDTGEFLRKLGELAQKNQQLAAVEFDTIQGSVNASLVTQEAVPKDQSRKIKTLTGEVLELQSKIGRIDGAIAQEARQRQAYADELKSLESECQEVPELVEQLGDFTGAISEIEETLVDVQAKIGPLEEEAKTFSLEQAVKRAQQDPIDDRIAKIGNAVNTCPCCGGAFDAGKLKKQLEEELAAINSSLAAVTAELSTRTFAISQLKQEERELKGRLSVNVGQAKIIRTKLDRAKTSGDRIHQLRSALAAPVQAVEQPDLKAELESKRKELEAAQAAQREYTAYLGVERERGRQVEVLNEKRKALDLAKDLVKQIKSEEKAILEGVIGGVCESANRLIKPVLEKGILYRGGEFVIDGATLETLSGSEELTVFAGLQMALAKDFGGKILLMDELGRLDPMRFPLFLKAVHQLIEDDVISQFIGVIPLTSAPAMPRDLEVNLIEIKS